MQEKYNNAVTLENTGADVMDCMVDFIYTGKLDINRQNAVEILVAADYLRIESKSYFFSKNMWMKLEYSLYRE